MFNIQEFCLCSSEKNYILSAQTSEERIFTLTFFGWICYLYEIKRLLCDISDNICIQWCFQYLILHFQLFYSVSFIFKNTIIFLLFAMHK